MAIMTYPGGKGGCYQQIINLIPPHDVYIEAFLGSGVIMKMKSPAGINIGIDRIWALDVFEIRKAVELEYICVDSIDYLKHYRFRGLEYIYCDPPYLPSTRKSQKYMYTYEMAEEQHIELLDVLKQIPCMVMISGYDSSLYNEMLASWNKTQFQVGTRQGPATETLWFNYPWPKTLHDYRYLGRNYRERERIHKKTKRWRDNLKRMPELERRAILSAMNNSL